MKTLDEVIDNITKQSALEIRDVKKPEKDRFWVDRETYNDALYYLRMYYSDKVQWESDRKHYEDWIEQYKDSKNKHQQAVTEMLKNPPLSWDELKQMEGKPVWMELTYPEGKYFHWGIIYDFQKVGYEFMLLRGFSELDPFGVMGKEQGKTWQAYRKERTDGKA